MKRLTGISVNQYFVFLVINKHSKMIIILLSSDKYVSDAENLHEHVMRHNHGTDENGVSINCMKIAFDAEYPFTVDFY